MSRWPELKRSNAELERFAYSVSHDLEQPLGTIVNFTQLLEHHYGKELDERAREYLGFIVDGGQRTRLMIDDLLTYSRVSTKGAEFETFNSEEALRRAIANLDAAISESHASVTSGDLPEVNGDAAQFVRLFQNLIGNGIKFRGREPPRVHVAAARRNGDVIFSVSDNGIGIDPKYFDRIFDIFQRLNRREEYPGTGVGLSICKRIVERHEGRIWVESQPGKGSTFYFSIPAGKTGHKSKTLSIKREQAASRASRKAGTSQKERKVPA